MDALNRGLLSRGEPPAAMVSRPRAVSPFVFTCDHASARIPGVLGDMGLSPDDLKRHIAWDIGAAAVARMLSAHFDATLVEQNYSRLVIDCNRPVAAESSIPLVSEDTAIVGNHGLSEQNIQARQREIFQPYHDTIAAELDWRADAGQPAVLISVHSFTPVYRGVTRPLDLGILFNRDRRMGHAVLGLLTEQGDHEVAENEPYAVDDDTDYTIPVHGERRGILHVMIEMRQDHIAAAEGQATWFQRLADLLPRACDTAMAAEQC